VSNMSVSGRGPEGLPVKKCFSAGELPCSSFSLGSFTRGPAGASRRGAYPGPGMHPSAAVGVMASRGQRDRGAWVGGRRLQRRRACAAGVCGTACLGGRGDALQPRPAGAAGSSGGLTGSADPCLLALLYGGAAAYHPQPLPVDALGAQLFCARAASHARQADDAAAAGAPLGGFGLTGGASGAPEGALAVVDARPHAGRAWPLPSAQQVRGSGGGCGARAGCVRCVRVA